MPGVVLVVNLQVPKVPCTGAYVEVPSGELTVWQACFVDRPDLVLV